MHCGTPAAGDCQDLAIQKALVGENLATVIGQQREFYPLKAFSVTAGAANDMTRVYRNAQRLNSFDSLAAGRRA